MANEVRSPHSYNRRLDRGNGKLPHSVVSRCLDRSSPKKKTHSPRFAEKITLEYARNRYVPGAAGILRPLTSVLLSLHLDRSWARKPVRRMSVGDRAFKVYNRLGLCYQAPIQTPALLPAWRSLRR